MKDFYNIGPPLLVGSIKDRRSEPKLVNLIEVVIISITGEDATSTYLSSNHPTIPRWVPLFPQRPPLGGSVFNAGYRGAPCKVKLHTFESKPIGWGAPLGVPPSFGHRVPAST